MLHRSVRRQGEWKIHHSLWRKESRKDDAMMKKQIELFAWEWTQHVLHSSSACKLPLYNECFFCKVWSYVMKLINGYQNVKNTVWWTHLPLRTSSVLLTIWRTSLTRSMDAPLFTFTFTLCIIREQRFHSRQQMILEKKKTKRYDMDKM